MIQIFFFAFSLDVDAIIGIVVLNITLHIALQPISVYITTETHVEHTAIDPYGICFCHRANFNPGMVLSKA